MIANVEDVLAIDGPSGSGKSTVARGAAEALGVEVLDTGAMYRAVTLAAIERGIPLDDADACTDVARRAEIDQDGERTLLDGRDVSDAIRGPEVTAAVSIVSAHPGVRVELVAVQRAWAEDHGGGVVEGRDIGTVVFPDARLKVFVTATDEERARRRQGDEAAAARDVDVDTVRESMMRRDELDSTRPNSPLRPADGALILDTTGRGAQEVVDEVVERFRTALETS
jgi:cytidylate kinase